MRHVRTQDKRPVLSWLWLCSRCFSRIESVPPMKENQHRPPPALSAHTGLKPNRANTQLLSVARSSTGAAQHWARRPFENAGHTSPP